MTSASQYVFLPSDRPPLAAMLTLGAQHLLTMFPATVLVAIITGFDVGATLTAAGIATIVAIIGSRERIPLWYGSSFSYIAPVLAVVGRYEGVEGVRMAQSGILVTGLINIAVGLVVWRVGRAVVDRLLPPIVTGSVAIIIGLSLSATAMRMASGACCLTDASGNAITDPVWWFVAAVTLLATLGYSVALRGRGLLGLLPVLLGVITGYAVALPLGLVELAPIGEAAWFRVPAFTTPAFSLWAILAIAPIALATIPESTAHLYQMSLYIDRAAESLGRPEPRIRDLLGLNIVLDGLGDCVNGLLGGCGGTSYGENMALMVITRSYSSVVLMVAAGLAILLGFVGKLAALVLTLPTAVTGGVAIYLFGVIALQGVALLMSESVDLFDPGQLAVGATMLVIGIGGALGFPDGIIPIGGFGIPAIVAAAVAGIALNLYIQVLARVGRAGGGGG